MILTHRDAYLSMTPHLFWKRVCKWISAYSSSCRSWSKQMSPEKTVTSSHPSSSGGPRPSTHVVTHNNNNNGVSRADSDLVPAAKSIATTFIPTFSHRARTTPTAATTATSAHAETQHVTHAWALVDVESTSEQNCDVTSVVTQELHYPACSMGWEHAWEPTGTSRRGFCVLK